MDFKQYLIDSFMYSQWAGLRQFETLAAIPDNQKAIALASHIINARKRWLQRLEYPKPVTQNPFSPVYTIEKWPQLWTESCQIWIALIQSKNQQTLFDKITYLSPENSLCKIKFSDVCLQLIYHDIHHRAQIQMLIREQGVEPPALDYFRTVYETL